MDDRKWRHAVPAPRNDVHPVLVAELDARMAADRQSGLRLIATFDYG